MIFMPYMSGSSPRMQLSPASLMKASSPFRNTLPDWKRKTTTKWKKNNKSTLPSICFYHRNTIKYPKLGTFNQETVQPRSSSTKVAKVLLHLFSNIPGCCSDLEIFYIVKIVNVVKSYNFFFFRKSAKFKPLKIRQRQ